MNWSRTPGAHGTKDTLRYRAIEPGSVTRSARPVTVTNQPEQVAASSSSASNATIAPSTRRAVIESAAVRSTISPSTTAKFIGRTAGSAFTVKISRPTGTVASSRSDSPRSSRVNSPHLASERPA